MHFRLIGKLAIFFAIHAAIQVLMFSPMASAQFKTSLLANSDQFAKSVHAIALSNDQSFIVACSRGPQIKQIKVGDWMNSRSVPAGKADAGLEFICIAQDRYVVTSRPYKKWLTLIDLETAKAVNQKYWAKIYNLAINPSQNMCFAGGNSTQLKLVALPGGQKTIIQTPFDKVHALAFHDKEQVLAIGGYKESSKMSLIELRDVTGKRVVQTLGAHTGHSRAVAFSDSGEIIASGGYDGLLKVWSRRKRSVLFERAATQEGTIRSLVFQGERWLWISQTKGAVQLLDLQTGTISVPNPLMRNAFSLCMLKDNVMVVGGAGHESVRPLSVWKIEQGNGLTPAVSMPQISQPKVAANAVTQAAPGKPKPPAADDQAAARKMIMEVLEIDPTKKLVGAQAADVASALLSAAKDEPNATARYVSLVESARYATLAGDVRNAKIALDRIANGWDVDSSAQAVAMLWSSQKASMTTEKRKQWATWAKQLMDEAEAKRDYSFAISAGAVAANLFNRTRDGRQATAIKARIEKLSIQARMQDRASAIKSKVESNPDDPVANTNYGVYLCEQNDWAKGITHLAKSNHASCKVAAIAEQKQPTSTEEKLQLARKWSAVEKSETTPVLNDVAKACVAFWLDQAAKDLSGLTKLRVEKERAELGELSLTRK